MALAAGTAYTNNARTTVTIPITGGTNPILPATGVLGFSVTTLVGVTQTPVTISSAVVTANAVVLTLANALVPGQVSKYSYNSGTGNVHDSTAVTPLTLGTIAATNFTNPAAIGVGSAKLNAARTIVTVPLTGGTTPYLPASGVTGWTVYKMVTGELVAQTVDTAAISGSNVNLTLHTAAGVDDELHVGYTAASGNVHDSTGGAGILLADVFPVLVDNPNVLVASQAQFGSTRSQIRVLISNANGALSPTNPTGFAVAGSTVSSATVSGNEVVLALAAPVTAGTNPAVSATSSNLTDSGAAPATLPDFTGLVAKDYQAMGHTKNNRNGTLRFGIHSNTL